MKPYTKHEEAIARRVCVLRGLEADKTVGWAPRVPPGEVAPDVYLLEPLWTGIAQEVRAINEVLQAATEYALKAAEAHDAAFFLENSHVDG